MFQVALYGTGEGGILMRRIIEEAYNEVAGRHQRDRMSVAAWVTDREGSSSLMDGLAVLDIERFRALYSKGLFHGIILPREEFFGMAQPIIRLLHSGVDVRDIYVSKRVTTTEFKEGELLSFFEPYLSAKYLPYLEFHVADHCNLRCKACEHYSGLVTEPHVPEFSCFAKDMQRLQSFIDDIGMIRILGGEPLLNPEINDYMTLTRELYPYAVICVVTNGLRLLEMPEDFFRTMREQRVHVHLSAYPPMRERIPAMEAKLREEGIVCITSPVSETFQMNQSLEAAQNSDYFYRCFQTRCHNFYEGKLAICPLPFMTKYFNAYFKKCLPEDGQIDLYEGSLTTEELKIRLLTPLERCRYCRNPVPVEWKQISKQSVLSDWIAERKKQ